MCTESATAMVRVLQPSHHGQLNGQLLTRTFNRIATELFEPQQVLAMIAHRRQRERPQLEAAFVAPTNTIDAELVTIWADVLGPMLERRA